MIEQIEIVIHVLLVHSRCCGSVRSRRCQVEFVDLSFDVVLVLFVIEIGSVARVAVELVLERNVIMTRFAVVWLAAAPVAVNM